MLRGWAAVLVGTAACAAAPAPSRPIDAPEVPVLRLHDSPRAAEPASREVSLVAVPVGQYDVWRLHNGNGVPVAPAPGPVFQGRFDRLTAEGTWLAFDRGPERMSVAAEISELPPGASILVGELPPPGARALLPPGHYRFVIGFARKTSSDDPAPAGEVAAPFDVRGLDEDEASRLHGALASSGLAACPAVFSRALTAFVRSAPADHLPRLLDLPAAARSRARDDTRPPNRRLEALGALATSREQRRLLAWAIGSADSELAGEAAIAVTEAAWCTQELPLCEAALARLIGSLNRPRGAPLDARGVEALASVPDRWPPDFARRLLAALEATHSDAERRALASAIFAGGAARLGHHAKDAVRILRRQAARALQEPTRNALAAAAAQLEGAPVDAASAPGNARAPDSDPEACDQELERIAPLLRYVGAASIPMTVLHQPSSVTRETQ